MRLTAALSPPDLVASAEDGNFHWKLAAEVLGGQSWGWGPLTGQGRPPSPTARSEGRVYGA